MGESSEYSAKFKHKEVLGMGGFGHVFRAEHKHLNIDYAIKRVALSGNVDDLTENVFKEAKVLAELNHPNIVRFFSVWVEQVPEERQSKLDAELGIEPLSDLSMSSLHMSQSSCSTFTGSTSGSYENSSLQELRNEFSTDSRVRSISISRTNSLRSTSSDWNTKEPSNSLMDDRDSLVEFEDKPTTEQAYLYIQMELCQKTTLSDWLRNNNEDRDFALAKNFFTQILNAIDYIHGKNIIHRDIKPSNIFFSLEEEVKLGDFGLVSLSVDGLGNSSTVFQKRTVVGTVTYMSPEQIEGREYNNSVDMYSAGLVLFELLSPFYTETEKIKAFEQLKANRTPIGFIESFPEENEILESLISLNPLKRMTASATLEKWKSLLEQQEKRALISSPSEHLEYCPFTPAAFSAPFVLNLAVAISHNRVFSRTLPKSIQFHKGDGSVCWLDPNGNELASMLATEKDIEFLAKFILPVTLIYTPGIPHPYCLKVKKETRKKRITVLKNVPVLTGRVWDINIRQTFHFKKLKRPLPLNSEWCFRVQTRKTYQNRYKFKNEYLVTDIDPRNPVVHPDNSFNSSPPLVLPYELQVEIVHVQGKPQGMRIEDKYKEQHGSPLIELY